MMLITGSWEMSEEVHAHRLSKKFHPWDVTANKLQVDFDLKISQV